MKPASLLGLLPLCIAWQTHAAALERSGQSIAPFLENGGYAEISMVNVNSDIRGEVQNQDAIRELGIDNFSTGNLSGSQNLYSAALKVQALPNLSLGLIAEQPYAADLNYSYSPQLPDGSILPIESANIAFDSRSLTLLAGYQPNPNWNLYGGLVYQTFEGGLLLEGQFYDGMNGYQSVMQQDSAFGWLAGISFQIPEYAFKSSLTYRSPIRHKSETYESTAYSNGRLLLDSNTETIIRTPQSVNFDIQTAVSPRDLIYSSLRWVNWQDFVIQPPQFAAVMYYASLDPRYSGVQDTKLISYRSDQWFGRLGWVHQWHSRWFSFGEFLMDSGTGNTASTFNPADGYRGIGLGFQYMLQPENFVSIGWFHLEFNKPPIAAPAENTQIASLSNVSGGSKAQLVALRFGHRF